MYLKAGMLPALFPPDTKEQYRLFVEETISHGEHEKHIMKDMKEDENWLPR